MLECREQGEMWRSVEKCVGVWVSVKRGESTGRDVGECGRGEGKCMGVNVKSVAKCVRVWGEVWWVWGKVWESVLGCGVK